MGIAPEETIPHRFQKRRLGAWHPELRLVNSLNPPTKGLMGTMISKIINVIQAAESTCGIRARCVRAIVLLPFICVLSFVVLGAPDATRPVALWLLDENHPVEWLTFLALLAGGITGFRLYLHLRRLGEGGFVSGFYLVFSLGLFITAMEEIAWGQWLFGFRTPQVLSRINEQNEVTLHNIRRLHGHSEFFRLIFGLGGLIGISLSSHRSVRKIGVPIILWPTFVIITILAAIDLYYDYYPDQGELVRGLANLSELVEMFIGISGFLYVWLNTRILASGWKDTPNGE